jgi:hypothetical protein
MLIGRQSTINPEMAQAAEVRATECLFPFPASVEFNHLRLAFAYRLIDIEIAETETMSEGGSVKSSHNNSRCLTLRRKIYYNQTSNAASTASPGPNASMTPRSPRFGGPLPAELRRTS